MKYLGIGLILLASGGLLSFLKEQSVEETLRDTPKRPNIVWITCEDMSEHIGSYGETVAKTPVLDQLAREGVRFTNVYSIAGVCAPSRSAIITGMYPTSIGTHNMRTTMASSATGKMPDGVIPYSAVVPAEVKCFSEYLRRDGYYCTNNAKTDYQFIPPVTAWDENSRKGHWRNRPRKDQPFFAIFNLEITHESQVWARENEPLLVKPEDVKVPVYYPDNQIVRKDLARFLTNVQRMDAQVGELLNQLKEDGLYDNTIIFFYSDHGDGLPYVKRELYDRGLRVPFIVRLPQAKGAGQVDAQLHSFVDLAPTMLSLIGQPIPPHLQGQAFMGPQAAKTPRKYIYAARDRMDNPVDRVRAVRDARYKYIKNYKPELPFYQDIEYRKQQPTMRELLRLRDAGQLTGAQTMWFRPNKPVEELYDCQTDPNEFTNMAEQPTHQAKLRELRAAHEGWINKYGDKAAKPEREMLEEMWPGLKQPVTEGTIVEVIQGQTVLKCTTRGASIGYRFKKDQSWQVYHKPLTITTEDSLYVVAHRIGYAPSEVVAMKLKR